MEVLQEHDPGLLMELLQVEQPSPEQRHRVGEALGHALEWVGPDYEPTPRTRRVEELLNAFYVFWPLRRTPGVPEEG